MSAIALAKQAYTALNREKPHSSITDWVEILTSTNYDDEAYDGIPELVDSINIQATGPTEASRAIRKKLKHGNAHQQYRALVILKALVENGGDKFQTSFADSQLVDALKMLAAEPTTDPKVKKKLSMVLLSWHAQFKDDSSMHYVANLYKTCGVNLPGQRAPKRSSATYGSDFAGYGPEYEAEERQRRLDRERREREMEEKRERERDEKRKREEEKLKAKQDKALEKAKRKQEEEARRRGVKRKPFNFEEEKPQVLTAIAGASQASINLVNAITLVNTETDSVQSNERVQECLGKAKIARKQIVRYIQLVENEDMIGTLIEANDRIIAAIEMYDTLSKPVVTEQDVQNVQEGLAAVKIKDSELGRLQEKQRAAVQRSLGRSGSNIAIRGNPDVGQSYVRDLQDLSFGPLGAEQGLPPPIRPSAARRTSSDESDNYGHRGSLSDYSDYVPSDEETPNRASTSSRARGYAAASTNAEGYHKKPVAAQEQEDPFADPFAD
ncbi:uncharacterized protein C8Q71DRAFT_858740 [Rhodofomes roseus]|uniref:VHS domain-containing protein n=1 Tax=Rhodofomes roseus TaxID=34475 RepID=A0ABQ8KED3_9APHY|nr:uncharacterized protein C8Q71DRAFT_858740 [Rhodofomes roseus]KAH9835907.1 hypothetical protein C8Q71DRAFT_858740 [Rhodofomes roseus]